MDVREVLESEITSLKGKHEEQANENIQMDKKVKESMAQ